MNEVEGEGTGVVVSDDGLIVTNNHVVAGSSAITVRFSDGRELPATLVGADSETDLAVIQVSATALPVAVLGDSKAIEPGDWVLAIGCPFGLEHTVTAGIISAKGRDGLGLTTFEEYIQTDAAINPGNSGGPLIDLDGKVIGIASAIASKNGGSDGVGFAIPSHVVERVVASIAHGKSVQRGWLGVSTKDIDIRPASHSSAEPSDGVLVAQVIAGTPADAAGLRVGDIIVDVDGDPTSSRAQFMRTIASIAPNTSVTIGVIRDGTQLTTTATLATRPTSGSNAMISQGPHAKPVTPNTVDSLGLEVRPLDTESAAALGVTGRGVYVISTLGGSSAHSAGLEPGDVVRTVNGTPIDSVASFRAAIAKSSGARGIRIAFERNGAARIAIMNHSP